MVGLGNVLGLFSAFFWLLFLYIVMTTGTEFSLNRAPPSLLASAFYFIFLLFYILFVA